MQSGQKNTKNWLLEFDGLDSGINPLTGWESSKDTMSEVKIKVRKIDIPVSLLKKDYSSQPEFRQALKDWLNDIWEEKNKILNLN